MAAAADNVRHIVKNILSDNSLRHMKAGLDIGSSLVKAVWMHHGEYRYSSTADVPLEQIARQMSEEKVTHLNLAGIGNKAACLEGFSISAAEGDIIGNEVMLQAKGTKRLLEMQGYALGEFLLVSIGTGTSYTLATKAGAKKFPIGNPLGGGFINGLGKIFGANNYDELAAMSEEGLALDLLIKDMIPEKSGTIEGEMVVANFGKAAYDSGIPSAYASIISTVAIAIVKDIAVFMSVPDFQPPKDVVFIGSTVARTPLLKDMLYANSKLIGKAAYFPEHGEFALAMGAYHFG
jgi:type II pantothenate kinase